MNAILDVGVVCVIVLGTVVLLLAAQAVVLPALGFLLTRGMALPPDESAGILLLAACPIGDVANGYCGSRKTTA
jgi:predicted Na+-dependent transporter